MRKIAIINKNMKKFKDFATKKEFDLPDGKKGQVDWTMQDIFDMLDYLSKELEEMKRKDKLILR